MKRENHRQRHNSIPNIIKRNGCRNRSRMMNALKRGCHKVNDTSCCFTAFLWQQQVILDVNFHLVMQYVLFSLTGYSNSDSLPVHYAARVFVHLSMCQPPCLLEPILAKCKQIRTVLEQYSTVDLSCVPPLGQHAYYTDKWSKSQGCISPIKPPGGIDLRHGERYAMQMFFPRVQLESRRRRRGGFSF